MALQAVTRLWLGGILSASRDQHLVSGLLEKVRRGALGRPLLFCGDGFQAYVTSIRQGFRTPAPTGKPGRPPLHAWQGVGIVQVIKQVASKRVVGVLRRVVQGTPQQVKALVTHTQCSLQAHVCYIERLNATFRSRIVALVRRGCALVRQIPTLHQAMCLVGTVGNFCAPHRSLRLVLDLPNGCRHWVPRTPAMAAGIPDHIWTVQELLAYRVPFPRWVPPKRRGTPSKKIKQLIHQWSLGPHLTAELPPQSFLK